MHDLIFTDDDDTSDVKGDTLDDKTSSSTTESSTDDDRSSIYETVPESQSYQDEDNDNLPLYIGACTVTVDYSDEEDLSDSEDPCSTIMDLRDDPHLDCCISRLGELGNPLGDSAAERSSSVTCSGEKPHSPGV